MTVYIICIILAIAIGSTIGILAFRRKTEKKDIYSDQRIELTDEELRHVSGGSAIKQRLLTDKQDRAVWKRAFRIWQQKPHQLAPITETQQECASCGTIFQGNFCPRCGQSAHIGRFSFKTAFLLFLDIWGFGNRSMFRSIHDLLLRPGYMIRDYVQGRQSAYFPPFKMFFILTTLSLLFSGALSQKGEQHDKWHENGDKIEIETGDSGKAVLEKNTINMAMTVRDQIKSLEEKSPALFAFLILLLVSAPLYLFFRRCPTIPDLRYSEHIVALTYTVNMYSIYGILSDIIPFRGLAGIIDIVSVVMVFVALKQFTGYSKKRLLGYIILTNIIVLIVFILVILAFALF